MHNKFKFIIFVLLLTVLAMMVISCEQHDNVNVNKPTPSPGTSPQPTLPGQNVPQALSPTPPISSPAISPSPGTATPTPISEKIDITIDHTRTDINKIPIEWIDKVKSNLKVYYFSSSHGNQVSYGIGNLAKLHPIYSYNFSGKNGALSMLETWADLGHLGNLDWVTTTRTQLDMSTNDRNVIIWAWCGGVTDNTAEGINTYLSAMDQLEKDYPGVKFVYMTGHVDGTGTSGNLNVRNNQIREFVKKNGKTLYDFADIESYDPDGNYFLDRKANEDCSYAGGNWAVDWCAIHPDSELVGKGILDINHTHELNCNLKGRAFWWLLARIAGWQGS